MATLFKVENTGTTIYSNFLFVDGNGNIKTFDILPNVEYYVNANSISLTPGISIINLGLDDTRYCFVSCCGSHTFSFNGNFNSVAFSNYSVGEVLNFNVLISSLNPSEYKSGCYELVSSGSSDSYACGITGYDEFSIINFDNGSFYNCESCQVYSDCCRSYQITNESSVTTASVYIYPCCDEPQGPKITLPPQTSISVCSSRGVDTIAGTILVLDSGDCPTCSTAITTTQLITTTTTYQPQNNIISPRNECDVITLFPMEVECFVINPTSPTSFDGAISLGITGGTPPYEILWETGALSQAITNLGPGIYSATVIDSYGDFTATTACRLRTIEPITTTTTTLSPYPQYDDICLSIIKSDKNGSFVEYYTFEFQGFENYHPLWTESGNTYSIIWNINQWEVSGWTMGQIVNIDPAEPPIVGWQILGSSGPVVVNQVIANNNDCLRIKKPLFRYTTDDATCQCDGNISIIPFGGFPPYQYSIDGGITFSNFPFFTNLCGGQYITVLNDSSGFTNTQVINLNQLNQIQNYILTLSYTGLSFEVKINPPLPSGCTINFDLVHTNSFTVGPTYSAATYLNTVTLNVDGNPVGFDTPINIINYPPVPLQFPCQSLNSYTTNKTYTWSNLTMGGPSISGPATTITGTITDAISPVLPTPQCFYVDNYYQVYLINPSIECDCSTVEAQNS
jgi:hypothetical protein